jgi:hypothetical protein
LKNKFAGWLSLCKVMMCSRKSLGCNLGRWNRAEARHGSTKKIACYRSRSEEELGHVAARGRGCVEYQETAGERDLVVMSLTERRRRIAQQERCLAGHGRSAAIGLGNGRATRDFVMI